MYTHICISSNNLEQSSGFYNAALEPLGVQNIGKFNDRSVGYSDGKGNMMLLMTPFDGGEASPANGGTVGFRAENAEQVDAFYAAGIANGGTCAGEPGKRPNAPGNAYGAYLRDPLGNKVCAFCQLPEGA